MNMVTINMNKWYAKKKHNHMSKNRQLKRTNEKKKLWIVATNMRKKKFFLRSYINFLSMCVCVRLCFHYNWIAWIIMMIIMIESTKKNKSNTCELNQIKKIYWPFKMISYQKKYIEKIKFRMKQQQIS